MGNASARECSHIALPGNATVEHESYCQRLRNAACGVCVGFVLVIAMIFLLWWNEFNYVHNAEILRYVAERAVEAPCAPDAELRGELIWASCTATHLWDFSSDKRMKGARRLFGETEQAQSQQLTTAWIRASSEIFQWVEHEECNKESDGHGGEMKICNYTYALGWTPSGVDSSSFACIRKHLECLSEEGEGVEPVNSGSIPPLLSGTLYPPEFAVKIGGYGVNQGLLKQLRSSESFDFPTGSVNVPDVVPDRSYAHIEGDGSSVRFFSGNALDNAGSQIRVGDVRTTFSKSAVQENETSISVVARQGSRGLVPLDTGMPGTMSSVNWAAEGEVFLDDFLSRKASENSSTTWMLRVTGWVLMFVGLHLITGPISLMPQAVPCIGEFLGEVIGCALCCVNLLISLSISVLVIGVAWVSARPLIGVSLLLFAATLVAAAICAGRKLRKPSSEPLLDSPADDVELPSRGPTWAPPPAVAPGQQQMAVTVPPGMGPGMQLQVQAPDGRFVGATVPPGVGPGQVFIIAV